MIIAERTPAEVERLEGELSKLHALAMKLQGNLDRLNRWRDHQLRRAAGPHALNLQDALNGQISKVEMFQELVGDGPRRIAVETGTFRGWTTRYLAGVFGHVVTFENDIYHIELARKHCELHPNISFAHGDSRLIERAWQDIPLPTREIDFAYLDAHWGEVCPLNEELDFLLGSAPDVVIFIDDFKIEDDDDYGYDQYPSMTLDLDHIRSVIEKHGAACFYPARRGIDDTSIYYDGLKPRGTLVVASPARAAAFSGARTIRPA